MFKNLLLICFQFFKSLQCLWQKGRGSQSKLSYLPFMALFIYTSGYLENAAICFMKLKNVHKDDSYKALS